MNKIIIIYGITFVFLIQLVLAVGVNYPLPSEIQLTLGESERFNFGLQTPPTAPVSCSFEVTDSAGLEIQFDEEVVDVTEIKKNVLGTVTAPEDTFNGKHTVKFCTICSALSTGDTTTQGSGVKFKTCDIPINVEVVGARTRENLPEFPEKEKPMKLSEIPLYYYLIILIILIALIMWYRHDKKSQDWTKSRKTH